jgi:hypothetical protein
MKAQSRRIFFLVGILACPTAHAILTTNNWTGTTGGNWSDSGSWSAGVPSINQSTVRLSNGAGIGQFVKTITIDSQTLSLAPSSLTISNFFVSNAGIVHNFLQVTNIGATALHILSSLVMSNNGNVIISNSTLNVGGVIDDDGGMTQGGGTITTETGTVTVGAAASGTWTMSDGTWIALGVSLGASSGSHGTLQINSGTLTMVGGLPVVHVGEALGASGTLNLAGGQMILTNSFFVIGYAGTGQMTVSGGSCVGPNVSLGNQDTGLGTLTVNGGVCDLTGLTIADHNDTSAAVWLNGGQLIVTNSGAVTTIGNGDFTFGQMTVSNGLWITSSVEIGFFAESQGTLTIAGGTNIITAPSGSPFFHVGRDGGNGALWITGGQFVFTNGQTTVGRNGGFGEITVSNGDYRSKFIFMGDSGVATCTMNLYGGTTTVYSNLNIGSFNCQATGIVTVAGGTLYVTNALHNATLEVDTGSFILNSGIVVVDRFVMTNACASFSRTGGTLIYSTALLDPNADADGDEIPNGYEQAHGLDPLDPVNLNKDTDGDGWTDVQEYFLGTDPTNANSHLGITAMGIEGQNIRITWTTVPGTTNFIDFNSQVRLSNSISPPFWVPIATISNITGTVTNFLDIGAATNTTPRYYRVRYRTN